MKASECSGCSRRFAAEGAETTLPSGDTSKEKKQKPLRVLPNMGNALNQPDGAVQSGAGPLVGTTAGL
ncbi:MAG TPA: hypothetical protein VFP28_00410, partial [Gemmatimonadales bacterium]|nr:hypothetical protein [Gemmatimonadales bacterium]